MNTFGCTSSVITLLHERTDRGEKGAAMVEYAILVAGMALIVAVAVAALGTKIDSFVSGISL